METVAPVKHGRRKAMATIGVKFFMLIEWEQWNVIDERKQKC